MSANASTVPSMRVVDPPDIRADVAAVLLAHARAADEELLAACRTLTDAQLDTEFDMGLKTVRATLAHTIGATRLWADVYAKRDMGPWLPDLGPLRIDQLWAYAKEAHDDWAHIATRFELGEVLERTRNAKTATFTRAQIIAHVTTHAVHHRAQIINMLRRLGIGAQAQASDAPSLPTGSVMSWVFPMHQQPAPSST